jgi:hypothetical protein
MSPSPRPGSRPCLKCLEGVERSAREDARRLPQGSRRWTFQDLLRDRDSFIAPVVDESSHDQVCERRPRSWAFSSHAHSPSPARVRGRRGSAFRDPAGSSYPPGLAVGCARAHARVVSVRRPQVHRRARRRRATANWARAPPRSAVGEISAGAQALPTGQGSLHRLRGWGPSDERRRLGCRPPSGAGSQGAAAEDGGRRCG